MAYITLCNSTLFTLQHLFPFSSHLSVTTLFSHSFVSWASFFFSRAKDSRLFLSLVKLSPALSITGSFPLCSSQFTSHSFSWSALTILSPATLPQNSPPPFSFKHLLYQSFYLTWLFIHLFTNFFFLLWNFLCLGHNSK